MSDVPATLLDTDVFSCLFIRRRSNDERVPGWQEKLTGRRVLISFQTRAEVLAGANSSAWGEQRLRQTREILDRTPTVGADPSVIDAYARLVADCQRSGHALQDRHHTADRWVAACAIAKDIELLSGDGVFRDTPGLRLSR